MNRFVFGGGLLALATVLLMGLDMVPSSVGFVMFYMALMAAYHGGIVLRTGTFWGDEE